MVRYTGASQCAHNVVTPYGLHHTFAQFGSGSFVPGTRTLLSRHVLIDPLTLVNEWEVLKQKIGNPAIEDLMFIDERAPVITPYHVMLNIMRLIKSGAKNSCGMGVGALREDIENNEVVLRMGDWRTPATIMEKLYRIKQLKVLQATVEFGVNSVERRRLSSLPISRVNRMYAYAYEGLEYKFNITTPRQTSELLKDNESLIFEGAQGMLLDEKYGLGDEKYRTWSDITFTNAYDVLEEAELLQFENDITRVGVLRTYFTRHGDGPFPTENKSLKWPDHNTGDGYQGKFRQGDFDLTLARRSIENIGGVDMLALNHVDRTDDGKVTVIEEYEAPATTHYVKEFEELLDIDGGGIYSHGPTAKDKFATVRIGEGELVK